MARRQRWRLVVSGIFKACFGIDFCLKLTSVVVNTYESDGSFSSLKVSQRQLRLAGTAVERAKRLDLFSITLLQETPIASLQNMLFFFLLNHWVKRPGLIID